MTILWKEVKIFTTHTGIEPLTGLLLDLGVTGTVVEDAQDFEEFLGSGTPRWDYVEEELYRLRGCETSVTLYLADNAQGAETFRALRRDLIRMQRHDEGHMLGRLAIQTADVREEDWADNWKKYFRPTPVGQRLLIKPTWETLADSGGRIVLEIDPSASFGTGTHDTTRLCMEMMETAIHGGESVLDMGCGSGILGIAALLLGAGNVTAVDIDENAVRIARENFAQNNMDPSRVQAYCGNALTESALREKLIGRRFGLILANIVADVVIAILPVLMACRDEGGSMLLSGIIAAREGDVLDALRGHGLRVVRRMESGGWVALSVG